MNILVVGGGGREHAIIWKLKQSPKVEKIYCAPGNGGIKEIAKCVDIPVSDLKALRNFAKRKKIDFTIVGPELPLTLGIVDYFEEAGHRIFGPSKEAAAVEGSKVYAKDIMSKYNVPTAASQTFTNPEDAVQYINDHEAPFVIKADGLAAGKGVILCESRAEAFDGIEKIMNAREFGDAGNKLIIEDFLQGEEVSILVVTDGVHSLILPPSQDHKALFEGDKGPNTGGMGAYAPAPVMNVTLLENVAEKIIRPILNGLRNDGVLYKGVLYVGLMLTAGGPKVLEFNCRFGDPETQAVLPLLKTDLIDIMEAAVDGRIDDINLEIHNDSAICVVMASGGYPEAYKKGYIIHGLDNVDSDTTVFHAGTKLKGNDIVTAGGRVLGITSQGQTLKSAMKKAYKAVGKITFDGAYYRKDIGYRALKREESL